MLTTQVAEAAPGSPAPAKPSAATDAKNKAEATKLLAEGNALSNDGDYVEALEKFRAAYAVYPSPKLLLNMGTMLRQLGRNVEAAAVYEQYLRDPEAEVPQVELLNRTLDEIDSLVGHLHITVSHRDAAVSLDGKPIDVLEAGTDVRVEPGTHKIVAEKKGFPPALVTVSLGRGEEKNASLKLTVQPTRVVEKSSVTTVLGISALAVGAFGFIASGITGGLVISANDNYQADCPKGKCATLAGYESAKLGTNLLIANGLSWAAGIAGAGLGGGLLLWGNKKEKKQSLLVGPGFIGIQGYF
ncbi:MAG TPA: PEGA domain-containing protein [Polyangium sp.]|nr:PEGA domain-containing protein [Polyangium sp.]